MSLIFDHFLHGGLGKFTKERAAKKLCDRMAINLSDTSNRFYNAGNRLKINISYEAHDFNVADIYYHNLCHMKYTLKSLSTTAVEEQNMLELT